MNQNIKRHVLNINRKHIKKNRWFKVVSMLAVIVIFCTTYALILPAITVEKKVVCGLEEHTHQDSCYQTSEQLICQKTEHTHTDSCYAEQEGDISADVETEEMWKQTFADVSMTKDWSKNVTAIAETQVGYKESIKNYITAEDGSKKGYTRYGAWYGNTYEDWSAMFASFCIYYAGVENIPIEADSQLWIEKLSAEDYKLYYGVAEYTPVPGDLIFFNKDETEGADHVGIVMDVTEATETTAMQVGVTEGDAEDTVQYLTYDGNDGSILGYGKLPTNPEFEISDTINSLETITEASADASLMNYANKAGAETLADLAFSGIWDSDNKTLTNVSVTVDGVVDKWFYRVETSQDGTQWIVDGSSTKADKVTSLTFSVSNDNITMNTVFRIHGDSKNSFNSPDKYSYSGTFTVKDILNGVKEGFGTWLTDSYCQDFGGTKQPETLDELYDAFAVYYNLPTAALSERMDGDQMYVDATVDKEGVYTYQWQYQDADGTWQELTSETGAAINVSKCEALLDGGANVRCNVYLNGKIQTTSTTLFVNPLKEVYDKAIEEINEQLGLSSYGVANADLSIDGNQFNNLFCYDHIPYKSAEEYRNYLAKLYLDEGIDAVKEKWDYYLYDIYDPSVDAGRSNEGTGGTGYPDPGTYGDHTFTWPKDADKGKSSPFNANVTPTVDDLNYDFLENGVDYSNFVTGLNKTSTAVAAGDENTERQYNVDIVADVQAKAKAPVAMVLQIQTSWQMFDLAHANKLNDGGNDGTNVGAAASNSELGTLYDIKHALLRFVDYMEKNYPGNNFVLGVTDVEHAGTFSMLNGTDKKGSALFVSNNAETLRQGLIGWDSFGNCEHVHYGSDALESAVENLESNLFYWKDAYGKEIKYEDIQKVAVIIGGPTENSVGNSGYGITLPWGTFQTNKLNSVYGIRTNVGTPVDGNKEGCISWLDYSGNTEGTPYSDANSGTAFTKKYVATNEDAIFNKLVEIAKTESNKGGIEITNTEVSVDHVTVCDTIQNEFAVNYTEPIIATIYNKDGSVFEEKEISLDDPNLSITENKDGTTTVSYDFGTVKNTKKTKLHFQVQAQEDYIGSNNVYTNVGTPELTYQHEKIDSDGNPTGIVDSYSVLCSDTPMVNVPIRFDTTDGDTKNLLVGENVDLKDLSSAIVKDAEDKIDNYDQTDGVLSYTWTLPDGTEVPAGSVEVKKGSIGEQTFPDRSSIFEGNATGNYKGTLTVTFTPNDVQKDNGNFCDEITETAVNPLSKPGNVWINVVEKDDTTKLLVRKKWDPLAPEGVTSVTFHLLANGVPMTDENGKVIEYTLEENNNWEYLFENLPLVTTEGGNTEVINYTVEETAKISGFTVSYESDVQQEEVIKYSAKVTFSLTPTRDANNAVKVVFTYNYGGKEQVAEFICAGLKKTTLYSYELEGLMTDAKNQPLPCEVISVAAYKSDGNRVNIDSKDKPAAVSISTPAVYEDGTKINETPVLVITNTEAYELPKTGGLGTKWFTLSGLLLTAVALVCGYELRRRHGRGKVHW